MLADKHGGVVGEFGQCSDRTRNHCRAARHGFEWRQTEPLVVGGVSDSSCGGIECRKVFCRDVTQSSGGTGRVGARRAGARQQKRNRQLRARFGDQSDIFSRVRSFPTCSTNRSGSFNRRRTSVTAASVGIVAQDAGASGVTTACRPLSASIRSAVKSDTAMTTSALRSAADRSRRSPAARYRLKAHGTSNTDMS